MRDQFGVHEGGEPRTAGPWRRVAGAVTDEMLRPRRLSPEVAVWTVIGILLVLFVAVLITGETGVARGGR